MNSPDPSFICAVCRKPSFHPQDGEHDYCGLCHQFTVDERELRVDVYRAANSHIALTLGDDPRSAVRVTHLTTGLAVTVRDQPTQMKNRDQAVADLLKLLATRLT